jgi:hypothetical protein
VFVCVARVCVDVGKKMLLAPYIETTASF